MWQVRKTVIQSQAILTDTDSAIKDVQQRFDYTSQDLNAFLIHADLIAGDAQRVEEQQQKYWKQVGPRTIALLDKSNALLAQTQGDEQQVSSRLVGVLEATHQALDSTNELVQDKDIKDTLANLNTSTANAVSITKHLDETTTHLNSTSAAIEKKVNQMLKPQSLAKSLFIVLLRIAADMGTIYKSF